MILCWYRRCELSKQVGFTILLHVHVLKRAYRVQLCRTKVYASGICIGEQPLLNKLNFRNYKETELTMYDQFSKRLLMATYLYSIISVVSKYIVESPISESINIHHDNKQIYCDSPYLQKL